MKTINVIIITVILFTGAVIALNKFSPHQSATSDVQVNNVSIVNGVQVITITAKGGYSPRISNAKAHIPTIIRMQTNNDFDCSSSVSIAAIGFRLVLKSSGTTDIPVPAQNPGTVIQGLCGMGMYNFTINFN